MKQADRNSARYSRQLATCLNRSRFKVVALAGLIIAAAVFGYVSRTRVAAYSGLNIIYALSNTNQLLRFSAATPGTIQSTIAITGLQAGESLAGIDFRPATGALFALGVTGGSTLRTYTINPTTGVATQVGGTVTAPQSAGVVAGTDYGYDFNPTVDRIRVVANSRDNFRLNPDTGAVAGADTALTAGANIVAAAYDRNFAGTTQTTLYAIDANTDQLVTIGGINSSPSPNTGAVTAIGNLGVNTSNLAGFDIAAEPLGTAFASLTVGGQPQLYTLNLTTGAATLVGTIGGGATQIVDIAAAPGGVLRFTAPTYTAAENSNLANITVNRTGGAFGALAVTVSTSNGTATAGSDYTAKTVTLNFADGVTSQAFDIALINDSAVEGNETVNLGFSNLDGCGLVGPAGLLTITDDDDGACAIYGIDSANRLLRFSVDTPGTIQSQIAVTGLQAGESLVGVDFRPATGALFALGVTGGTNLRTYSINTLTGAATQVGGTVTVPQSAGVGAGTSYGVDFNPTVDRIRVVADSRDNFRLNPDTGAVAGADTALTAGAVIVAAAYDRNFVASPQPATTLYAIDANTDQLVTIGGINSTPSPNTGAVTAIGALGFNTSTAAGFDIANDSSGAAIVLLTVNNAAGLYSINLATGAATPIGLIGAISSGASIVDIAIPTAGTVQLSASNYLVSEGDGSATITVTRSGGECGAITVTAATSNGTATAGQDYQATTATLNFPAGVTSQTFTIPILNDNLDETDETINLALSANVGGRVTLPSTAVLTISDDDTAGISIADVTVAEGNASLSNALFTISLSNPTINTVTVSYATANGSATAGTDYLATSASVTFNPGDTSKTISVQIIGDTVVEPNETFFVNLSNPVGAPILDGQAVGTIVNDDINLDLPGNVIPVENAIPSDQKAGSVLIFPVYSSTAGVANLEDTRFNITNIDSRKTVAAHLFLVDGSSCNVSDMFICLTGSQTTSFLASDLDPGITGYLIAVAVDGNGCPIIFNGLIGDEYVKFAGGHAANLSATAIGGLSGIVNSPPCAAGGILAQLNFDGVSYQLLPRILAVDNLQSRANGSDTILILDRIGGNLATGAARLGAIFGLLFDDAETAISFSFNPGICQFRGSIGNGFPRTTPRFPQFVPAGHSGWMKLGLFDDGAIVGAAITFNPNLRANADAFSQGHNLHILTLTNTGTLTIPVFPASCL